MGCDRGETIRANFDSLTAALAFNNIEICLIDTTSNISIIEDSRVKNALTQGGEIFTRILKRVINPNDSATIADFDLANLFDQGTKDIRWFYEVQQRRTGSFLSHEDIKNLWQWMKKEEVPKMMENRTSFLENLIKTMERLAQKREEIRSGEVLFLMELFSIFWELLTYNKKTTTRDGYVSVSLK